MPVLPRFHASNHQGSQNPVAPLLTCLPKATMATMMLQRATPIVRASSPSKSLAVRVTAQASRQHTGHDQGEHRTSHRANNVLPLPLPLIQLFVRSPAQEEPQDEEWWAYCGRWAGWKLVRRGLRRGLARTCCAISVSSQPRAILFAAGHFGLIYTRMCGRAGRSCSATFWTRRRKRAGPPMECECRNSRSIHGAQVPMPRPAARGFAFARMLQCALLPCLCTRGSSSVHCGHSSP